MVTSILLLEIVFCRIAFFFTALTFKEALSGIDDIEDVIALSHSL